MRLFVENSRGKQTRPEKRESNSLAQAKEVFGEVPDYESFVDTQIMLRPVIPTGGRLAGLLGPTLGKAWM